MRRTPEYIVKNAYLLPERSMCRPAPERVASAIKKYIVDMSSLHNTVHPIEYAALVHKGLVDIHPFVDGNGRTARLLMNLVLIQAGYGLAIIPPVRRVEYIDALRISQREKQPDNTLFICLIADCVIETQRDYCRLLGLPLRDNESSRSRDVLKDKNKEPER